jgi:large subunit ribosomal protein L24
MGAEMNIRKGDTVQILSGNDRGKRGTVLSVLREKDRVLVEGVNLRKHHTRPNARDPQGGIREREVPVHVSNVQVVCPKTDRPTRIRHAKLDSGRSVRVSVRSGEMIDTK